MNLHRPSWTTMSADPSRTSSIRTDRISVVSGKFATRPVWTSPPGCLLMGWGTGSVPDRQSRLVVQGQCQIVQGGPDSETEDICKETAVQFAPEGISCNMRASTEFPVLQFIK